MKPFLNISVGILFFLLTSWSIHSQENLTPKIKSEIVDSVGTLLQELYIFPEVAKESSDLLRKRFEEGGYSKVTAPHSFAAEISKDLYSITKDGHLNVFYNTELAQQLNQPKKETPLKSIAESRKMENFGFKSIEVLGGNVGYLDLRVFDYPRFAGETAVAAMNFLSGSEALIVDLRKNIGGSPEMVRLLQSYFFGPEPVHLNDLYRRTKDSLTQSWTLPYVPGKRLDDVDIYVLTSNSTFSAGEEFAYNLQQLNRATLVGEVTGGGANPGSMKALGHGFVVFLPTGRAVNPVSKTNWEGVGVKPDHSVRKEDALKKAYDLALKNLLEKETDSTKIKYYQWHLKPLLQKGNPYDADKKELKKLQGTYNEIRIELDQDELYLTKSGKTSQLIPLDTNYFMVAGSDNYRVRFSEDGDHLIEIYNIFREIPHRKKRN